MDVVEQPVEGHKPSSDSQNSGTGSFLDRIKKGVGGAVNTILNSARRSSINVNSSDATGVANVQAVADANNPPFGKSKTTISSGNPFRQSEVSAAANQNLKGITSARDRISSLLALSGESEKKNNNASERQRLHSQNENLCGGATIQASSFNLKEETSIQKDRSTAKPQVSSYEQQKNNFDNEDTHKLTNKATHDSNQQNNIQRQSSLATDLIMRLSMNNSLNKKNSLVLMDEDGTVMEISS